MIFFKKCAECFLAGMKAQWDEDGGRILLGDNTGGRAVMLRPIEFQYAGVGISTGFSCVHMYLALCIIISNKRKIRLAPILPDLNYCVSQGSLVVPYEHRRRILCHYSIGNIPSYRFIARNSWSYFNAPVKLQTYCTFVYPCLRLSRYLCLYPPEELWVLKRILTKVGITITRAVRSGETCICVCFTFLRSMWIRIGAIDSSTNVKNWKFHWTLLNLRLLFC
jgi:hypothetical protein